MIRCFFSRKFQGATLALALSLCGQLAYLPYAMAASGRQALLDQYVQRDAADQALRFLREAEAQGYRVTDLQGNAIGGDMFLDKAGSDFILTSPAVDGDAGFAYRVRVRNQADGVANVALVVSRPGDSRVLARRSMLVDYHEDAAVVRLRLAQTEQSLDAQLRQLAGERHASFWQRAGRALQSLIGEPSAQAGVLSTGVRVALGFAGVGLVLLALDGVAEHYGVVGAHTGRYVILIGLAVAASAYYLNFTDNKGITSSGPIPVGG